MPEISLVRPIHRQSDFSNFILLQNIHKSLYEIFRNGIAFGLLRGGCSYFTNTALSESLLWGFCFGSTATGYLLFENQIPTPFSEMPLALVSVIAIEKLSTAIASYYLPSNDGNHQMFLFACFSCNLIMQALLPVLLLVKRSVRLNINIA